MRGESSAGWRSGGQGVQRGQAACQAQPRTGLGFGGPGCRCVMRGVLCGGCRERSEGGGQERWRSWSAT